MCFERVRAQYVTPPDDKKLIEAAINGMLSSLDPHSSFMNAEQAADMRTQTKGEFGGLGIEVTMDKDLVKVVTPIEDTPAAKAGILSGDYISKIDGTEVRGLTLNQAVEKMRGKVGEPIKLEVIRQGADKRSNSPSSATSSPFRRSSIVSKAMSAICASFPSPKRPSTT